MIKYIFDGPNAVTLSGLVFTTVALYLVLLGQVQIAVVLLMWAVMLDHMDGWLARRSVNRPLEYSKIGGDLDSLTDMVSGAVAPGLIAMTVASHSMLAAAAALCLNVAGAIRISYFNNFGLNQTGKFYGVPMTYTVPVVAACFMIEVFFPSISAKVTLPLALFAMAALHVAPFGPPPVKGIGFVLVGAYAVATTVILF